MEQNREQLISLWESNFGDSREYISIFLESYKDKMRIKTLCVDGKVVCSCYLLPAFISTENGTEKEVWYLYALSTLEEEKGKGYAGRLLRQIEEDYFLVPSPGLEEFYNKRGLKKWLVQESIGVDAKECGNTAISIVSAEDVIEEYEVRRNTSLAAKGYIRWDCEALRYALWEHEFCGGRILRWEQNGAVVFALVSMSDKKELHIKEITAEPARWEEYATMAAEFMNADKAVILGKTVMTAYQMNVTEGEGYFGLPLG